MPPQIKKTDGLKSMSIKLIIKILFIFSLPCMVYADFRALLIGIDYQNRNSNDPIRPLCGATNDVKDVYHAMTEQLGIPAHKIKVLSEAQATRDNILSTFQHWFINGTKAGDQLFFMYSGHGVLVPDLTQTQQFDPVKQQASIQYQQLSEAFVPYDSNVNQRQERIERVILDSDFQPLLKQLKDRELTLFIDSCHSGGITRNINGKINVRRVDLPWIQQDKANIKPLFRTRGMKRLSHHWHPPYRFFAAAKYNQYAHEYSPLSCGSNGAMTYAFLKLLKQAKAKYSNQQVLDFTRQYLKEEIGLGKASQEPQYHGPIDSADQRFVLFNQSSFIQPIKKPKLSVDLWLDKKGRRFFKQNEKVAIYYRVSGLKQGQKAWLTLLNIAPNGTISMLYPQPADFYRGIGKRGFLNAPVEARKTYRIPRQRLAKGENILIDAQLVLSELGRETFYAIIADRPLKWQDLDLNSEQFQLTGKNARGLIRKSHALVQKRDLWAEKSLQIEVRNF